MRQSNKTRARCVFGDTSAYEKTCFGVAYIDQIEVCGCSLLGMRISARLGDDPIDSVLIVVVAVT